MLSCAWTKTNKYSIIILQSIIKITNAKTELGGGGRQQRSEAITINQTERQGACNFIQYSCVCCYNDFFTASNHWTQGFQNTLDVFLFCFVFQQETNQLLMPFISVWFIHSLYVQNWLCERGSVYFNLIKMHKYFIWLAQVVKCNFKKVSCIYDHDLNDCASSQASCFEVSMSMCLVNV